MSDTYKANYGNDQKYYVDGPGDGLGYYSGTLRPELRFEDRDETDRAAEIANIAFKEGYKQAQRDIRTALGVEQ